LDLRTPSAEGTNASHGSSWPKERTVEADFLEEVLAGRSEGVALHPRGIRLRGARISGALDLQGVDIPFPLTFRDCHFEQPITLELARVAAMRLPGCWVPGVNAAHLFTRGNVQLNEGFRVEGEVDLGGAQIGGSLWCFGGSFTNPAATALRAQAAKIGGSVVLGKEFLAGGEVVLSRTLIGGNLVCDGGIFKNPGGLALDARQVKIGGSAFLREGFQAEGRVTFIGARMEGDLDCSGGTFKNPGDHALGVQRASIGGAVFLRDGFSAEGEVALLWARIGRWLSCRGGIFTNPQGSALCVSGANIADSVFLNDGFSAEGEVDVGGAQIGSSFICAKGTFKNPTGKALRADGAKISGSSLLNEGFRAEGEVRLPGTKIGDSLDCRGGTFSNPDGDALVARHLTLAGAFFWQPENVEGLTDLENAHVGSFVDAKDTWPAGRTLRLEGFSYDAITTPPDGPTVRERIAWLGKSHHYSPQPYEQLAAVLRRHGHDGAARDVAIAKQRARRRGGGLRWWARGWSRLLAATVGYGYRPWLAAFWVAGIWVLGVALFTWGPAHSHITMSLKGADPAPRFSSWIYVLDSLLPIVNLHQRDFWIPNAARPWGWLYVDFGLFAALAGWALATAVVAALTGLMRKD
jgi:hypothetical protein